MSRELSRSSYLEKNVGDFAAEFEIGGRRYVKVDDLRYGTNPHQPAAYYREVGVTGAISDMEILKNGKSGLSQTNLEDISGALNIVKFCDVAACAVIREFEKISQSVSISTNLVNNTVCAGTCPNQM